MDLSCHPCADPLGAAATVLFERETFAAPRGDAGRRGFVRRRVLRFGELRSRVWSFGSMFESLSERLGGVFERLRGRGALTEADVRTAMREVRIALLEAD